MIYWKLAKPILMLCSLIVILPLIFGILWSFLQFNLPFVNSGDLELIYILLFLYWIAVAVLIFGFDISGNKKAIRYFRPETLSAEGLQENSGSTAPCSKYKHRL